ncbi:hypothetical protein EGW08_004618, partial [Elysia chlorotica]
MSSNVKYQRLLLILLVPHLVGLPPVATFAVTNVCPIFLTTASLLNCPFNRDPVCNLVYYLLLITGCIRYSVNDKGYLKWPNMDDQTQTLLSVLDQGKAYPN